MNQNNRDAERLHQYDKVPCDKCGLPIVRGHTRLYTGQVMHHPCAEGNTPDKSPNNHK